MRRSRKSTTWPWTWGGVVTVLVPLSTLALVLLGYGYTLAVETVFGVDAALVAHSLPEYLQLSSHVVAHLLTGVYEAVWQMKTYRRLYEDIGTWLKVWGVVWTLIILLWLPRARWLFGINALYRLGRYKLIAHLRKKPASPSFARRGCHWLLLQLLKLPQHVIQLPNALWLALGSLVFIFGWPLLTLGVALAAVLLIGYLYSWLPYIGLVVGTSALQMTVVTPSECISVRSRDQILVDQLPLPPNTAHLTRAPCVCLEKDGDEIARGRLVVATAEAVVLFEPMSGRTRRLAIDDAIIRPVSSLD